MQFWKSIFSMKWPIMQEINSNSIKSKIKRSYQMRIYSEIHFYPLDNKIFIKANKNAVRGCQKPTEVYYAEYIQE